ncbi:MAG: hypothetical protein ACTSVW_07160 [Candidatus Njordarchaeales archaeon]
MFWSEKDDIKVILKRYFRFDSEWSENRKKVIEYMGWDEKITSAKAAEFLKPEDLTNIWNKFAEYKHVNFYGKFWFIKNGKIKRGNGWEIARKEIEKILKEEGIRAYAILKVLLDIGKQEKENYFEFIKKIQEISGKSISWRVMQKLESVGIVHEYRSRQYHEHWIPEEIIPVVSEVLSIYPTDKIAPTFSSNIAQSEFEEVMKLETEFEEYLKNLLKSDKLEQIIEFGKKFDVEILTQYLKNLFGDILYLDSFLAILQQYAIADSEIINPNGMRAGFTGFNLALFGAPGTGKTFAIDDMIRGNERLGVPSHGLPGRNRYCGGMSAAKFIRIAEAYEGRKFNFIVPEFNDWFKYKGMVEPLKLAMEQREIKYETKSETIGPYRFNSFFSVNYNTQVEIKGYKVTVSDPNFNAIEDRMLCRLHKMTKERFKALRESQRKLRLGKLSFGLANNIREHLTLVYAIQTNHPLISEKFQPKKIILTEKLDEILEKVDDILLEKVKDTDLLAPSVRLAERAIKVASAGAMTTYFKSSDDHLKISDNEIRYAVKFYIEEMNIRCGEQFNTEEICKQLGV